MSLPSNISENTDEDGTTIINPYNFNNKLVTTDFLNSTLKEFDVDHEIKNLDLYQQAWQNDGNDPTRGIMLDSSRDNDTIGRCGYKANRITDIIAPKTGICV